MSAPGAAEDGFGIDATLIEERLTLTPTERWERHAQALALVEELRAAGGVERPPQHPAAPAR